jgi:hypothetical protein
LWRALHVEVDPPPRVLEDEVGLTLAAPDDGWRNHPDMSPFTKPFSFFMPTEILALARQAGFRSVRHVSAVTLAERYFAGRTDGLRPPENSEEMLRAMT